jgi:hypothetical protein
VKVDQEFDSQKSSWRLAFCFPLSFKMLPNSFKVISFFGGSIALHFDHPFAKGFTEVSRFFSKG